MESFAREPSYTAISITVTLLPIYSISYQMLDPPQMIKKATKFCKDLEYTPDSRNKCYCLYNASPYVVSFTSTTLICNLTYLFGVFNIKSSCNANFTVDVTSFFAFFVLIFMLVHATFSSV